jgi:hypothetical protein
MKFDAENDRGLRLPLLSSFVGAETELRFPSINPNFGCRRRNCFREPELGAGWSLEASKVWRVWRKIKRRGRFGTKAKEIQQKVLKHCQCSKNPQTGGSMEGVIRFVLENFTLALLVLGLVASAVSLLRLPRPWSPSVIIEAIFSCFILFSIALSYLYNFVAHVFFSEVAARFIGWADSPFQREVGFASLGFSVVGFLAFRGSFDMRVAAVVGTGCFLLGAASGHILEILRTATWHRETRV